MRRILLTLGVTVCELALLAVPARADVTVTINAPASDSKFGVAHSGTMKVTFRFDTNDPSGTYRLSIGRLDGTNVVAVKDVTVDPATETEPIDEELEYGALRGGDWRAIVRAPNGGVIAENRFSVERAAASFVSPSNSDRWYEGFAGPLRVHVSTPGYWRIRLALAHLVHGSWQGMASKGVSAAASSVKLPLPHLPPGQFMATAYDPFQSRLDRVLFRVYPFSVDSISAFPARFYPLVRDGYRDCTRVRWTQSDSARVSITANRFAVKNLGVISAGAHSISWCGLTATGKKLPVGIYHLRVTGRYSVGKYRAVDAASVDVRIATKLVRMTATSTKYGVQWAQRDWKATQTGGSCNWANIDQDLLSTCLYAVAGVLYRFGLPTGAKGDSAHATYYDGIEPCHAKLDAGQNKTLVKIIFVSNGSNGWSQCQIHTISVRYHWYVRR